MTMPAAATTEPTRRARAAVRSRGGAALLDRRDGAHEQGDHDGRQQRPRRPRVQRPDHVAAGVDAVADAEHRRRRRGRRQRDRHEDGEVPQPARHHDEEDEQRQRDREDGAAAERQDREVPEQDRAARQHAAHEPVDP